MYRRTRHLVFLVALVALMLTACVVQPPGSDSSESNSESAMKLGLVTDVGRVNDRSFNQSAWEGVQQAAEMMGLGERNSWFRIGQCNHRGSAVQS